MITSLQNQDKELDLINISKKDIVESITLEDVEYFLTSLGVTTITVNKDKGYLICPTICHNPLENAESMKLYWYQDNKIFKCYTECDEVMTIFKLYQKFVKVNEDKDIEEQEAVIYVSHCLKHILHTPQQYKKTFFDDTDKYIFDKKIPSFRLFHALLSSTLAQRWNNKKSYG